MRVSFNFHNGVWGIAYLGPQEMNHYELKSFDCDYKNTD